MAESFKKKFNGIEYAFYRTNILSDTTYFIMFDDNGNRNSVRIAKINGRWKLPENTPLHVNRAGTDLIRCIEENELVK
jgi:hypothetical protein